MELRVTGITFLGNGKMSVEVYGGEGDTDDPPDPPGLDNVRLRVYMEFAPTDSIEKIQQTALRVARESMANLD